MFVFFKYEASFHNNQDSTFVDAETESTGSQNQGLFNVVIS